MPTPLITAHRGASRDAPENTLAALRLGFDQGADAAECDVRLTRDGHVVLMHDATAARTAGADVRVADCTLAALRALDAGGWRGEDWRGEKIPLLAEALAVAPPGGRMLVEVKCGSEILPALENALQVASFPARRLILMSFDRALAATMKRRFPAVETHWIVETAAISAATLAGLAREHGLDGVNLDRRFPIDAEFVRTLHEAGLKAHVWTVDDVEAARSLTVAGVDSITTNRPGWLRERLAESV